MESIFERRVKER